MFGLCCHLLTGSRHNPVLRLDYFACFIFFIDLIKLFELKIFIASIRNFKIIYIIEVVIIWKEALVVYFKLLFQQLPRSVK
jgi:hypothetical protein